MLAQSVLEVLLKTTNLSLKVVKYWIEHSKGICIILYEFRPVIIWVTPDIDTSHLIKVGSPERNQIGGAHPAPD